MELFIQIRNGQPFEHPILGDNFRQAFPNIDVDNLPESFACFVRVEPPVVGVYEVYEGVTYEWRDSLVTDVHHVREMTTEEVISKQNAVKQEWAEVGYASWFFDDATCSFLPPIQRPDDGYSYVWDEEVKNWIKV